MLTVSSIVNFCKISVKISVLGPYTLIVAPIGGKFGKEEWTFDALLHGPLLHAKLSVQRVAPHGR